MLKIAFVGYGNSVRNYHLPYLVNVNEIVVKKIFRREQDRINDMKAEAWYPDVEFTSQIKNIYLDDEIELIVVNTHVDTHAEYAIGALKHGKNVLVEKPFAHNAEEARRIFALAEEKGLIVMANQNRRYDGDFLTLKKVIDSGKLGNIVEIQSHYDYFNPVAVKPGFGMLYGLAVHTLDQMWSIFGQPDRVVYDVRSFYYPGEGDDFVDIDLFYGGTKVTIKCSQFVKKEFPKFVVHGDKGSFIKYSSGHQVKNPHGPTVVNFSPEEEKQWGELYYRDEHGQDRLEKVPSEVTDYGLLYRALYQSIRTGAAKPVRDDEVLGVMQLLEQGVAHARSQKAEA
ncbi:oxidoreductase [Superficieibacter electus]|uniref:Oxidoreductase n=1 Tax=Superficieibacter electus TaxID=2022662 RepID=A0A2P5GU33_9ENTR|nr:Gfo/Idh/MocA family oxidoreductase [Superficieibacter electus]POP47234.1 oxidoreductase [Superficieibacter electus]POP50080.1 oxidoreductase [Superficieibacter electus]